MRLSKQKSAREISAVNYEEFAVAWNTSASVDEALDKLNRPGRKPITYEAARNRAKRMREAGIDMKPMRRNATPLTPERVAKINQLLREVK